MQITRANAPTTRTTALSGTATRLPQCIGCEGCTGLCAALLDMIAVPEAVLGCGKEAAG